MFETHRRVPRPFALSLITTTLLFQIACGGSSAGETPAAAEWVSETSTDGDVTTVRTLSGSVWGGSATLEEEMSIGVELGEEAYMLGSVRAIGMYGDEIFVLDQQIPAVRVYDLDGRHLRDLGAEGSGPGEFQRPESMVIDDNGSIYLRDPRNGRIMILGPDGAERGTITITSGFSTSSPMVIGADGTLYNYELLNRGSDVTDWQMGMVPKYADEEREGEPIEPPDFAFDPPASLVARANGGTSVNSVPFTPQSMWTFTSTGAIIAGVSDDYSFDIIHPDGRITRVEKSWEPVPVLADEASYNRRQVTANMQNAQSDWTWNGAEIPSHKPAFSRFVVDLDGRVWVSRPGLGFHVEEECNENPEPGEPFGTSCWSSTSTWEVFDADGRFLGGAELPEGVRMSPQPHIVGDSFLSVFMDEAGTVMIKRFRLVLPRGTE